MNMQLEIPAVYMRGGTSKGLFFHEKDLPRDGATRDRIILAAYGSPDPDGRQVDGMGGAFPTSSKVAIISPSKRQDCDVDYYFGQVSIDKPHIEYKGNCGNISSAVGPFAIDEGLVEPKEPITTVRIFQVNTKKIILAKVHVSKGVHDIVGEYSIDGVPGKGSKISLHFKDPAGSVSGRLLPSGNTKDMVDIDGIGKIAISVVDAANPVVFVKAVDIGLKGIEIQEIDSSTTIKKNLETIRRAGAELMGLFSSSDGLDKVSLAVPKIVVVGKPQDYQTIGGKKVGKDEIDMVARAMTMGKLHKTYAVTGAICTAGAARIEGTVVQEVLGASAEHEEIRIGHPSGVFPVHTKIENRNDNYEYMEAVIGRTARCLMKGRVFVPSF